MRMESQVKFCSPQNMFGASQQINLSSLGEENHHKKHKLDLYSLSGMIQLFHEITSDLKRYYLHLQCVVEWNMKLHKTWIIKSNFI